jgi:hypothetical protein
MDVNILTHAANRGRTGIARGEGVRALVIGALGVCLVGCSRPLPPQAAAVSAAPPTQSMSVKAPAPDAMPVLAANTAPSEPAGSKVAKFNSTKPSNSTKRSPHERALVGLASRFDATPEKLAEVTTQAASSPHVPLPASAPRRPAISEALAKVNFTDAPAIEPKPAPEPNAIQQPVVAATAAEQPALPDAPPDNPDLLVAILLARPDTRSVSDLAGKTVAIDGRYAQSNGTVRTAIVAAGAPEVQLSEGATTAIDRLTNGEVPAAVVALLSPDSAETFPDIKGFKIFHVPLSPRAARPR